MNRSGYPLVPSGRCADLSVQAEALHYGFATISVGPTETCYSKLYPS